MPPVDANRLADLLIDPHETLEIELKGWIDIAVNNDHKAVLAKSLLALANHGGGFVIVGFNQTAGGVAPDPNRPGNLAGYTPDTVNAVVQAYAEPVFHCDVSVLAAPSGETYPIISVPGGHRTPIRSKRASPNGQTVAQNTYYIRRPGPQSQTPQTASEWDALIQRCITNARGRLLDQFRIIMAGGVVEAPPNEIDATLQWFESSLERWRTLISQLAAGHVARMPRGHFAVGYRLIGNLQELTGPRLLEAIRHVTVRHTGWPEFWVPNRPEITPYIQDGNIECWLPRDGQAREAYHSDFWRISPQGAAFLIRGLQEDDAPPERRITPGTGFDITTPTWRIGEALLHAARLAAQLGDPQARVALVAEWTGLHGRRLVHVDGTRMLFDGHVAQQNEFRTSIVAQADQIVDGLPELVSRVVVPLYELFDFFVLPASLVVEELSRMRSHNF